MVFSVIGSVWRGRQAKKLTTFGSSRWASAAGRFDFFESALAFMAGYSLRAFLIAQSPDQIEKAYGPNNSILDNCHVQIAFATNDERTAKRVSDALGSATEMRSMRNYAGHRLAPWLSHVMVSRQETAPQLLTPGEIMQLTSDEQIVLVSGTPPIRAKRVRYYFNNNFQNRITNPPELCHAERPYRDSPASRPSDWGCRTAVESILLMEAVEESTADTQGNGSKGRNPGQERPGVPTAAKSDTPDQDALAPDP